MKPHFRPLKALRLGSILVTLALLIFACSGDSNNEEEVDTRMSFFEMLEDMDPLNITIETDVEAYIDQKDSTDEKFQQALMIVEKPDGTTMRLDIEVRPRGVTRKELCDFPPMMVKAPKELREEFNLRKTDHIKLVSYCKKDEKFQDLVMKEMLNYKLFSTMSDYSYAVKLAKVRYTDSGRNFDPVEMMSFMIEPTDGMADRHKCKLVDDDTAIKTVYKEHYKNFVVFQYMIGNTDWNLSARHNIRLLKCDQDKGPIPVPYDFDYSGLVNAPYAKPHPMLPIDKVTERLFQWRGSAEEDFSETFQLFNDKKSAFYKLCSEFPHLDAEIRQEIIGFLDQFYENMNNPAKMKDEIMKVRNKN